MQNEQEFSLSSRLTVELMQAVFSKGACFRFQVKGFSMLPFIWDNDIVTLSPFCFSADDIGKSVACVCPVGERLIVHRIVARNGDHYLIKGDNCSGVDYFIDKKNILGYVTAIERNHKSVLFGLGPERKVIAFLSRKGMFSLVLFIWRFVPKFLRRFIKCRMLS